MSIQLDIADVFEEVGVAFTVERLGVTVSGGIEFLTYTPNAQVTKPFVKEHFLEVSFKASTAVLAGDVLTLTVSGASYLVMNSLPEYFENEIIKYSGVLYMTNVVLTVFRATNVTSGYDTTFTFVQQHTGVEIKALIYAPLFGNTDKPNDAVGTFELDKNELYLPEGFSLQAMDRVVVAATGEIQQVDVVIPRRFPAVVVCQLSEDTRE